MMKKLNLSAPFCRKLFWPGAAVLIIVLAGCRAKAGPTAAPQTSPDVAASQAGASNKTSSAADPQRFRPQVERLAQQSNRSFSAQQQESLQAAFARRRRAELDAEDRFREQLARIIGLSRAQMVQKSRALSLRQDAERRKNVVPVVPVATPVFNAARP